MEESEIYALFAKRKKRQKWITIIIILVIIISLPVKAMLGDLSELMQNIIIWLFIIFAISLFVFTFFNWRCPSCDRSLGRNTEIAHCMHCGVKPTDYNE